MDKKAYSGFSIDEIGYGGIDGCYLRGKGVLAVEEDIPKGVPLDDRSVLNRVFERVGQVCYLRHDSILF